MKYEQLVKENENRKDHINQLTHQLTNLQFENQNLKTKYINSIIIGSLTTLLTLILWWFK